MKSFFLGLAAALALCVGSAQAQTYNSASLTISGTVAASGTMTLSGSTGIIDVQRCNTIAIQPVFAIGAAGTSNVVFAFAKSADKGATWETVPSISGTIAAAGTGTVSGVFSVSTGGASTLKLVTIVNSNTSTIINPVIKYGRKPGF
jgi:hypothetical protein